MEETKRGAIGGQEKQCIKFTSNSGGHSLSIERGACERAGTSGRYMNG